MSGEFKIELADIASKDATRLLDFLSDCLQQITGDSGVSSFSAQEMNEVGSCFVIARDNKGIAVGCGALRKLESGVAELKRMYAQPEYPGLGTSILHHLEFHACQLGYQQIWLETRRVNRRAVGFYLARGYQEIENYGQYKGKTEAVCFAKNLDVNGKDKVKTQTRI
ncbi:GNAT family N-acetyltransferase [Ewingella sp. S1.OA.A_B6]